jgi:hypothetical protein
MIDQVIEQIKAMGYEAEYWTATYPTGGVYVLPPITLIHSWLDGKHFIRLLTVRDFARPVKDAAVYAITGIPWTAEEAAAMISSFLSSATPVAEVTYFFRKGGNA